MSQTPKIIGLAMAAFAIYLPVAFMVGRSYVPKPMPDGAAVEKLLVLGPARAQRAEVEDLGRGRFYHSTVAGAPESWRYVVFSTSDNSDPRTNGRSYWAVVPR